jgi:hypothetical protein
MSGHCEPNSQEVADVKQCGAENDERESDQPDALVAVKGVLQLTPQPCLGLELRRLDRLTTFRPLGFDRPLSLVHAPFEVAQALVQSPPTHDPGVRSRSRRPCLGCPGFDHDNVGYGPRKAQLYQQSRTPPARGVKSTNHVLTHRTDDPTQPLDSGIAHRARVRPPSQNDPHYLQHAANGVHRYLRRAHPQPILTDLPYARRPPARRARPSSQGDALRSRRVARVAPALPSAPQGRMTAGVARSPSETVLGGRR